MLLLCARSGVSVLIIGFFLIAQVGWFAFPADGRLPNFGRDTVLVWKIQNLDYSSNFVVRIAEFWPDRFLEWEDDKTQGTLFMSGQDIQRARCYMSTQLFEAGLDKRGKNATALWLSRRIFDELKKSQKAKIYIDGVQSTVRLQGEDSLMVEVNRTPMALPVIRVVDDRGSERWFLDQAENPLLVKHVLRNFSQTLVSITTDRSNTLRWIKGRKLADLPK